MENQSLAEAMLPAVCSTDRHHHKLSEEFYFILDGSGTMEVDGETQEVGPGDAVLIPAGARHRITAHNAHKAHKAHNALRFLCCCAPPYDHADTYFD